MSLPPGRMVGPYEILSPIGAGGMGEVLKAKDTYGLRPGRYREAVLSQRRRLRRGPLLALEGLRGPQPQSTVHRLSAYLRSCALRPALPGPAAPDEPADDRRRLSSG